MFLDWLLETEKATIRYEDLKMLTQDSYQAGVNEDENLPYWQNTTEEDHHWTDTADRRRSRINIVRQNDDVP